jgi:hypothetical protein
VFATTQVSALNPDQGRPPWSGLHSPSARNASQQSFAAPSHTRFAPSRGRWCKLRSWPPRPWQFPVTKSSVMNPPDARKRPTRSTNAHSTSSRGGGSRRLRCQAAQGDSTQYRGSFWIRALDPAVRQIWPYPRGAGPHRPHEPQVGHASIGLWRGERCGYGPDQDDAPWSRGMSAAVSSEDVVTTSPKRLRVQQPSRS